MTTSEALVFLSCGGTIEKVYCPITGQLGFDHSRVAQWASQSRVSVPWRTETVMLIDSLDMTDQHRIALAKAIAQLPESRVVVLHGTDTMVDSAKTVMLHRKETQVIVFTGAMIPASLEQSDALFNFGFACAAAQTLPPGTYIAMSGRVFPADQTRKNRSTGFFEPLSSVAASAATEDPQNGTLRITKRKITGAYR